MQSGEGLKKEEIRELLEELGKCLGFEVIDEVNTGFSRVDLVWFDKRIQKEIFENHKKLRDNLLLPIVGFEIEEKTYVRKMIRGDIDSLNSLAPHVGCIVLSRRIATVTRYSEEHRRHTEKEAMEIAERRWKTDLETFKRYAEANPFRRIVVITDEDLIEMQHLLDSKKKVIVNVKFQELTKSGAMRFPVFLGTEEVK